jgi:hypothetical protein
VSNPGAQSHLPLTLGYEVSNLEIHRRPVEAAPGYVESDWLAMTPVLNGTDVPPALGVDLGPTDVPIPLKTFPALPLIVSQTGVGDPTLPPTLATASLWTFGVVYSHEHAAQDHVLITAELNLIPPPQSLAAAVSQDLFTSLAQYVAVSDELNGLLAGLTDSLRDIEPSRLAAAVTTFADLASLVAGNWTERHPSSAPDPQSGDDWNASESHPFSAVVAYQQGSSRWMQSYTLTRLAGAKGPALAWPKVECQAADGEWIALTAGDSTENSRTYLPPGGKELLLSAWPRLALSWPGLNVGATQNGRVKLAVIRNPDLLGPSGPATAKAFIYRTATVTATNIVTPAISRTDPLSMNGASMEIALQAAFDALFPPVRRRSDLKLTLGLFYGYTLVEAGLGSLVSELAVGLIPDQTLNAGTATLVADALKDWQDQVNPNPTGGLWVLSLMLYSSLDPGKRVLLSIDRLTYSIAPVAIQSLTNMPAFGGRVCKRVSASRLGGERVKGIDPPFLSLEENTGR